MTASVKTFSFGVKDAKISPLATDTTGQACTYGTAIDVPGIKKVTISGVINAKKLRGDNQLITVISFLEEITLEFEYSEFNADIYALLTGAAVTFPVALETPYLLKLTEGTSPAFFGFEAITAQSDETGGNEHLFIPKAKIIEFPSMGFAEEDFQTTTIKAQAFEPIGTNAWIERGYHTTPATLWL